MNRSSAKLLTLAGVVCVTMSAILPIYNLTVKIDVSPLITALCLIVGVGLIAFSLAYYTEK